MILIDFQKTFDTIDHNISLLKMSSLEFSREVIDWCKSNLSSRKFHVNVHDKFSTSVAIYNRNNNLNNKFKSKLQTIQNKYIRLSPAR